MKKKKFSIGMPFVYLLLVIWALTTIYPLVWVVMNSFKDKKQIVSNSFAFPLGSLFTLDNYEKAINNSVFLRRTGTACSFPVRWRWWLSSLQVWLPMRWYVTNSEAVT